MSDAPIANIELYHIALPTRREHKWTRLSEPIGGYVLVKMFDAAGGTGWGEAPVLKDWGGDFGRYFGETPATTIEVICTGTKIPISARPRIERSKPGWSWT
jgi:muconate cycloisomerase